MAGGFSSTTGISTDSETFAISTALTGTSAITGTASSNRLRAASTFLWPSGYEESDEEPTLVLFLHVGCHFCEESMPFYSRLLELSRQPRARVRLVAIFPDPLEMVSLETAQDLPGLKVIPAADFGKLGVLGTPTLALIDQKSVIRRVWRGQLSVAQEAEVLAQITRAI